MRLVKVIRKPLSKEEVIKKNRSLIKKGYKIVYDLYNETWVLLKVSRRRRKKKKKKSK